jgi:hypothetical protein
VLPGLHDREAALGGVDVEGQGDDAVVVVGADLVAGLAEDGEHLAVLRQHLGLEPVDAVLPRGGREVLEEDGAEPAALVGVADVERDLGARVVELLVAADGDDVVAQGDDERDPAPVVDVREVAGVGRGQFRHRREEPQVDRLRRLPEVEPLQPLGIGRPDGPQVGGGAVPQQNVSLPVLRIRNPTVVGHAERLRVASAGLRRNAAGDASQRPAALTRGFSGASGQSPGARSSNSPFRTPFRKERHSWWSNTWIPPAGSLESRTATKPSPKGETSTQPLVCENEDLRHSKFSTSMSA